MRYFQLRSAYQALLCVPAFVYLLLAAQWYQRGADRLTGDEPYYLLAAESIVDDLDVDLKNNLQKHGSRPVGMNESHLVLQPHGWFSIHNLGLSAFVALPWAFAGPTGARLMMALACGLAAPVLYRTISRIWPSAPGALMISLALALAMPFLHGCNQIYPDLLAGIVLLFSAERALEAEGHAPRFHWGDLLLPAALAYLPWLHIKYTGAALVALAWYVHASPRRRWLVGGAALTASVALLASYNWYAFGKATGPYSGGALAAGINSAIVFMGLHFDQTQGMFFEQPLWLLGLVGLPLLWRQSHTDCLWWGLLYAAAIVPNAMHPVWYGGHSFVGRFGATAVLLWSIPLAHASREWFGSNLRGPAVLAALSLGLQGYLARNWLTLGDGLCQQDGRPGLWQGCVWAYNCFYPAVLKDHLPYWQPFVDYWRHPANLSAVVLAAGCLACGCFFRRRMAAVVSLVAFTGLAVAIVALTPAKSCPAACAGNEAWGIVGRPEPGRRVAQQGLDEQGLVAQTPHFFPSPGTYRVNVAYEADPATDPVGFIMFHDGKNLNLLSPLAGDGGPRQKVSTFEVSRREAGRPSTVLIWYGAKGTLSVSRLAIERLDR